MSEMIDGGYFDNLTVEEIVAVVSIFTPIRLNENDKYINIEYINCNDSVKNCIKSIKKIGLLV